MLIATPAAETLFIVASICIVFFTIVAAVAGYALYRTAREAQTFVRRMQDEALRMLEWQRRIDRRTRFAGKWLRIVGERVISGRD